MQPGDLVRLLHGSVFRPDHFTLGTVTRMPLPEAERTRITDSMVLVQSGQDPRPRPMRLEDLEELGRQGTPLEEIQRMHGAWLAKRQERLKQLESIAAATAPKQPE